MKSLQQHLKEVFSKYDRLEDEYLIIEGLNINEKTKTVSLTDEHNKGVDFSLVNNPVYSKIGDIEVISIFKRTKLQNKFGRNIEGNPFIYALKNKYNWKFDISDLDIIKYVRRFLQICDKLNRKFDVIVTVPSSSDLNEKFMKVIADKTSAKFKLNKYFSKARISTIYDNDLIDYDAIEKDYPKTYEYIENEVNSAISSMSGDNFEAKNPAIKPYLKYIKYIIGDDPVDYLHIFNDKDILILDDVYSTGETISKCVENIQSSFNPKSITVVTLLSKY